MTDERLKELEASYHPCSEGRKSPARAGRGGGCRCDQCLHSYDPEALELIAEVKRLREELRVEREVSDRTRAALVDAEREIERLRAEAEMACLDPRPDCGCAGCQIADEMGGA